MNQVGRGKASEARHFIAALLLICSIGFAGCDASLSVPKGSVPVGSARVVGLPGNGPSSSPADRMIVTHARDGWHVFLAWSPQAGAGCLVKYDRTLTVDRPRGGRVDRIVHPCSGTIWDLDGRYVFGPSSGPSDQRLIPLHFQENATAIVVDLAQQDAWRRVTSTTPAPRPPTGRLSPSSAPTPVPAPTPTRSR